MKDALNCTFYLIALAFKLKMKKKAIISIQYL